MSNLKPIIEDSMIQYSGAVLQNRALIDVRDGLKPSARQIFYSMLTRKLTHDKPYKKTANAVGMAMADFYIHGDSSCEGVIMRAGQPFAMRYPLVDVKGNAGSLIESGNWAAMRYTESRLSKISNILFTDINKDTIEEWRDNYDNTKQYPSVLPSKGFYNVCNGSQGIGIGMASSIPQYNLKEMNQALEHLLLNPNCDFEDIYIAPDFATGAILLNEDEVKDSMRAGTGFACKLRSIVDYDKKENCFIVTEIPYSVYTNTICGELEEIINSEENPGIERFNDLTGKTPLIKIYLTKRTNPDKVLKYLYKETSLQYYYSINFTMLDMGRFPRVFTWKEMLQAHIDHEKEVYRRGFEFDLKKITDRLHIIEGLLICLANIDEVVHTIKTSKSAVTAAAALKERFLLDDAQTKAILDMKLSRLAH
jgi:DNA gyrase subunit A